MRIYISGSPGSGKTTYASKLSKGTEVPVYHTDDLYNAKEKRMYTRKEIMNQIPLDSEWIVEGAYYIPEYIQAADEVIYLKIGLFSTISRIIKRWIQNKELRKSMSFFRMLVLLYTTIKDMYATDNIPMATDKPMHYKEKDRYKLCEYNAKKFTLIKS